MSYESRLSSAIGKMEAKLNSESSDMDQIKRCAEFIAEDVIKPWLSDHCHKINFAGSSYDGTAILKNSDIDLQFCLRMPCRTAPVSLIHKGWQGLETGPSDLMGDNNSLSYDKARKMVLSSIDRGLGNGMSLRRLDGHQIQISRSTGYGPAAILNVEWAGHAFNIDIVVAVSSDDLHNSGGCNLVAKPYTRPKTQPYDPNARQYFPWRQSFTDQEKNKMREYNRLQHGRRRLTLLRIVKLIKAYDSQLQFLTSYFYKNSLYHFCDSYCRDDQWDTKEKFANRFKDYWRFVGTKLRAEQLDCYFERTTNVLQYYDSDKLQQLSSYINGIVDGGNYMTLIQRVPDMQHM